MEDALIVAVCGQSVLYDTNVVSYRDRIKTEQAWVVVGEETGIPDQLSGNESDPDDVPAAAAAAATAATPAPAPAPVPAAGPAPRPQSGMKRKRASGVPGGNTPIQEAILQALQRDGQLCADAHFLNGLLPSLKRLPPDTKEYVKFQIHKVIFDATQSTLNLEPV
ncbi:unnamed protein product [Boreogadus saida]